VDYNRETGARAPGSLHLLRNNLKLDFGSGGPLPANDLWRDLDKIDRAALI